MLESFWLVFFFFSLVTLLLSDAGGEYHRRGIGRRQGRTINAIGLL